MVKLGIDRFCISLIEEYPCDNKTELRVREGHFIKEQGTLNAKIAGRNCKQFYQDNRKKLLEYRKNYYKNNKEQIAEKSIDYKKIWYENNKEKLKIRKTEKIECDICKSMTQRGNMLRHKKTDKCQSFIVTGNIAQ